MLALLLQAALAAGGPAPIEVLGIVASARAPDSVAILRSEGVTRVVGPGDPAFGGVVAAIEPGRVLLERDGAVVEVRLAGAVAEAPAVPARGPVAAEPPPPEEPVRVTLEKQEVDRRLLAEIPRILASTRLNPVREGGRIVGFSLDRIPEGTLLSEVGLVDGDVLTHINRVPLDSLATLAGLWPRLQGASELTAQVRRSGRTVSLGVSIR